MATISHMCQVLLSLAYLLRGELGKTPPPSPRELGYMTRPTVAECSAFHNQLHSRKASKLHAKGYDHITPAQVVLSFSAWYTGTLQAGKIMPKEGIACPLIGFELWKQQDQIDCQNSEHLPNT